MTAANPKGFRVPKRQQQRRVRICLRGRVREVARRGSAAGTGGAESSKRATWERGQVSQGSFRGGAACAGEAG